MENLKLRRGKNRKKGGSKDTMGLWAAIHVSLSVGTFGAA